MPQRKHSQMQELGIYADLFKNICFATKKQLHLLRRYIAHKPHPGSTVKVYVLRQVKEFLSNNGLI